MTEQLEVKTLRSFDELDIGKEFWLLSYHRSKHLNLERNFQEPILATLKAIKTSDDRFVKTATFLLAKPEGKSIKLIDISTGDNSYYFTNDKETALKLYINLLNEHLELLYDKTEQMYKVSNKIALDKMRLVKDLKDLEEEKAKLEVKKDV